MEQELNLVEILKDCPEGTELYSPIFGILTFIKIDIENYYPVFCKQENDFFRSFTKEGKYIRNSDCECMLFPSKDQRDWSKFKVESEMVDGEIYYTRTDLAEWIYIYKRNDKFKTNHYVALMNGDFLLFDNICTTHTVDIKVLRKATEEEKRLLHYSIGKKGLTFNEDTKELMSVKPELIDGEIYYAKTKTAEWIYIYKKNYTYETNHHVAVLNNYLMEFNNICTTHNEDIIILRNATEEEKRMFFKIIEENDRKWDADKKELVRIEKKFDISTLQHFDKVLVRDNNSVWRCDFYNSYVASMEFPFKTVRGLYKQCIPYNEDTKHLVDKNEKPPEKYINW